MDNDKKRIAFYASYYLDKDHEIALKAQYRVCFNYLARLDYDFAGYYSDTRSIASPAKREGLMKMLRAARDGKLDQILIYEAERLALNPNNLYEIIRRFDALGTQIFTCIGGAAPLSSEFADAIMRAEQEAIFNAAMAWELYWDAQMKLSEDDENAHDISQSEQSLQECTA